MKINGNNYSQIRIKAIISVMLCSAFIFVSCGSRSTTSDSEGFKELQELVSSRDFEIQNDWALPIGGGNINLIGNPNLIKIKNDSVEVYLPYFGVRQSGGNYGSAEGGINFEGKLDNFEIEENASKGNIEVKFEAKENNENYDFIITLFPNRKTRTRVISSQRTSISYEGEVKQTSED
ncbi:MAG: DUF4251 domain-containing protein [Christiangramia sp.]|nr:DUF4251 domain-containing protein [Christiangramia sp.]